MSDDGAAENTLDEMARGFLERDVERIGLPRDWHGFLTRENAEAVAGRIRELLAGRLFTTLAEATDFSFAKLETSRYLTPAHYLREIPHAETGVTVREATTEEPYQHGLVTIDLHVQNGTWYFRSEIGRQLSVPGLPAAERRRSDHLSFTERGFTVSTHSFYGEKRTWTFQLEDGLPAAPEEE